MEGWIKVYRSIKDHWIYPKNRPMTDMEAWITMLIETNHEDGKIKLGNNIIECNRGEKLYSLDTWAALFNWNKSKVRRFFSVLEKDSMIVQKATHKSTHLTICNYDKYQGERHEDETKMKRKRNDSDTNIRMNKNDKNKKEYIVAKIQKEFYATLIPFVSEFGKDTVREFYDYWSEPNKSKTKIKWQIEKTWDTHKRLLRWVSNDFVKKKVQQQKVTNPQMPAI